MLDYSTFSQTIIQQTRAKEDALPLRDETCRSRFLLHSQPTDKICVFFHGFTATPEQFLTIGKAFFKAGYNVLIPLLPGHGIAGDWNEDNPPPLPEDQLSYIRFGLHWLQVAQSLGKKVILGGLSGGSTLAAWLSLECPQQIYRALVFAPYLSGSNKVVDLFVRIFNIYFEWKTEPGLAKFGYGGFLMPSLRVFLDMGDDVLERAEKGLAAPMFIISSESDRAVGHKQHEDLFESAVKYQPKTWYHRFEKVLDIQHNMMTEEEGNEYVDLLIFIAKAYIESDITWAEVEAISSLIEQGYSFDTAVNELQLSERVSPDLSLIVTPINQP